MAVADNGGDAWNVGEFFRSALGVATGGDDARFGVEAMGAADVGAGFAVGFGGDAAGVDDDHIGLVGLVVVRSGIAEESGDGFTVGAGGATAKVFDVEGGWHGFSLSESGVRGLAAVSRPLAERWRGEVRAFPPLQQEQIHCKDGAPGGRFTTR